MFALHDAKGYKCEWLFRSHHAPRNYDRRTALPASFRFEPTRQRRRRGKLHIVFQVTAHGNAIGGRAQRTKSLRIFLALHQECARICQRASQKRSKEKPEPAKVTLVARE